MARVGYARVSSMGQSLDIQLQKLGDCKKVFQEKASGTTYQRPQLNACLEYVREGDTLAITRLDRLARSTMDLCNIAAELQRKEVNLQVLDQNIDTGSATGRLLFNMLGAIAQFETEIRSERQMEGIHKAKARGVAFGRQAKLSKEQVEQLRQDRAGGLLIREIMSRYGLSKPTVYRLLGEDRLDECVYDGLPERGPRTCRRVARGRCQRLGQ